jgi:hypothetical protein
VAGPECALNLQNMPTLKVNITNEAGEVTGDYTINCVPRPGLDTERYDTQYSINLLRAAAERHRHLPDFLAPQPLSMASLEFYLDDPIKMIRLQNVNELWLEIENLMHGARLNFATARTLKELEDEHNEATHFDVNARFDLHLEKMDRFHLAVFEMARIEDLVVRLVHEFFGDQLMEIDTSKEGWEKKLTWDRMKDALNTRGQPYRRPNASLELLEDGNYESLIGLIRRYRSPELLKLTRYRDLRIHRVAPSVDRPELAVDIASVPQSATGTPIQLFRQRTEPEYMFLGLYDCAKKVYLHLLTMLHGINEIVHA